MFRSLAPVAALLLLAVFSPSKAQQDLNQKTCSNDQMTTIQPGATAWLGGIIGLNNPGTGGYGCGDPAGSMQAFEAVRWVLDLLNKKDEYLSTEYLTDYYVPGIRLGMKMKNYCMKELSALGSVVDIFPEIGGDDELCSDLGSNMTIGIIGASTSDHTMALSDEVSSFDIPVISYEAKALQLTEPGMYTNFMRTISPDGPLMDVIVEILAKLQWHHLVIVYDSGTYGSTSYAELHAKLVAAGICLTSTVVVDDEDVSSAGATVDRVISAASGVDTAVDDLTAVIFFGSSSFAEALVNAGTARLPDSGNLQWLFVDFPLDDDLEAYKKGIIAITSGSRHIVEFEDHWIRIDENNPSAENPWFQDWFEYTYDCKFSPGAGDTDCASIFPGALEEDRELLKRAAYTQNEYVEASVMAVFTYARALRTAQMDKCGNTPGVCEGLKNMTHSDFYENYLKKVDFTFTATERVPSLASPNVAPYNAAKQLKFTEEGDIIDPSYFIYNYNDIFSPGDFSFQRVGTYVDGYLDMNIDNVAIYDEERNVRLTPIPASSCGLNECSPCLGLPADVKFFYEPGDIIINGIFSLHDTADGNILTCGSALSPNQYEYLEAMVYALDKINNDNTILPKIKLGGLGMDDCSSPILGQAFLAQVQRGNIEVTDYEGNNRLDPRLIEAYVAAHNTELTVPLAEAMNGLMRPMVGYRADGSELDDETRFPYFLRAVPGIRAEIEAIILLLKKLNWMYVQVIDSPEDYSRDAERVFRDLAAREGICITAEHNIGRRPEDVDEALTGVSLDPSTHPVVVLLDGPGYRRLLEGLSNTQVVQVGYSHAFIATSRFGTNRGVVEGFETQANQFISLSYEHSTLETFKAYLEMLDGSSAHPSNPWYQEWYQTVHDCSLTGSDGLSLCDESKSLVDADDFELVYEVDSVINAVRAIAIGLDATLKEFCGNSYTTVCTDFLTNPARGTTLRSNIEIVSFTVEDTSSLIFKFEDRTAALPFEINRFDYDQTMGQDEFAKVGDVNPFEETLNLNGEVPLQDSMPTCATPCLSCLYMFNHLNYWYVPGDLVIASIFDAHYSGTGPYDCGAIRPLNGALYTEVFNFALQRINDGNANVKLNGVTLGGLSFDGCSNPPRASAIVNRVHTGMEISSADGSEVFQTRDLVSWLSYDSESTVDAAGLLSSLGTPIVSPGATARELDDKDEFSTFFRTIPLDSVVVRGMAEFVSEMGWSYVVSLNAPEAASRQARDYFRELLAGFGICVSASYEFETDGSMEVIYNSIASSGTQIVAVFADPDRYIRDFLQVVRDGAQDLVFVANRPWGLIATEYRDEVHKSVSFTLDDPTIDEFATYLAARMPNMVDNPWFDPAYEALFECNLPGTFTYDSACPNSPITSYNRWEQDIWTLSTIDAVYALAEGIHRTLQDSCGVNYNGLCNNFTYSGNLHAEIMAHMDEPSFTFTDVADLVFQFVNREADRRFKVMQYRDSGTEIRKGYLNQTGALTLEDTNLKEDYTAFVSECADDCAACLIGVDDLQVFSLISGDVYLIGLFDVHKSGSTPFTCGEINEKHGLPLLEAFNYAIDYVNDNLGIFSGKLSGIQIGGIALDTCQSATRAANLVANIQSGTVELSKDSVTVNPRYIEAYIGPMDTEGSLRVADILTQLSIPQISYGATGVELLDTTKYDYFLRSVPADDKQARAIVSYLKKFQYNDIQVVSSFDEIGEPGREEFFKLAEVNKICVKIDYVAGEMGSAENDAAAIIDMVAQDNNAVVVVLWMKDPIPVLRVASSIESVRENYMFIVTDKWGADPTVLEDPELQELLEQKHLLVLDVETADIPSYDEYLETKTPDNYNRDPWFKEYFEDFQDCYWDTQTGDFTEACDKSSTIPRADHYVQDPYVLYVINAVFSAAEGIHKAVQTLCTTGGSGACDLYMNSGERRQEVMKGLKQVNFIDDTHQPFFYTEDGQSDRGFHIYNVTNEDGPGTPFRYENVGSYNDTHFLKLDITYEPNVESTCDVDGTNTDPSVPDCICEFPPDLEPRYMLKQEGDRGLTLVYVGDIHQTDPDNSLACGDINTGPDLQKLLAFFYAIERINANIELDLPDSIKLDGLALDSCTNGIRLGQDVYNVLSGNPLCDSDDSGLLVSPSSIVAFIVDQDHNALPISSMLTAQGITTISPTAGITQLADRYTFPYFLSIRGNYDQTASAILATAQEASWDYLSVIYSDSMQYNSAMDALLSQSRDATVCVGDAISLSEDITLDDAKDKLESLSAQVGAQAVILFVTEDHLTLLLQASQELGLAGRFTWVVPADWAHNDQTIDGLEAEYAGSLRYETRSEVLEDFNNYVASLTYTNRQGIPDEWFHDIYETIHQCNLLDQSETSLTRRFSSICTEEEVISPDSDLLRQDPGVLHTIMAVYAAALGLNNIPECQDEELDVAACLQLQDTRSEIIRDGIAGVEFRVLPDLLGDQTFDFAFDVAGYGEAGLVILNYQASSGDSSYVSTPLGTYIGGVLTLDTDSYAARNLYTQGEWASSTCAVGTECTCQLPGSRTWTYSPTVVRDASDIVVGGTYMDYETEQLVTVQRIPGTSDRFEDTWAIIVTVFACVGAVVSLCIFIYLMVMYPVRGGTSILGFMVSFGIILLYLTAIAFIAHADTRICGLRRFVLGVVYAFVYSSLLVKLVDCWRVHGKDDSHQAKYNKLGRPLGLFMVTMFLVLVQVMINTEWLILEEPEMVRIFYRDEYWPRCTPDNFYDEGLVLSLCYVMVLIVVCFGLALLSVRTLKNHRESRWILGILILSVPTWVIWCMVSILGPIRVRDGAVAIGLIVNATIILLLVPIRKLYLLHKYNVLLDEEEEREEEEARSAITGSQQGDYYSVYGRQYDNRGHLHDSGSVHGSQYGTPRQ